MTGSIQLIEILDACEAANLKHLQRIDKLEDLCRELYEEVEQENWVTAERHYKWRMEELGLLDDPSENERLMDTFFKDAQGRTPIEQLEALTEACRKQVDND